MKAAYDIKQEKTTLQVEIVDRPKNKFLENVQLLNVDHVNNYIINYLVIETMMPCLPTWIEVFRLFYNLLSTQELKLHQIWPQQVNNLLYKKHKV